MHHMVEIPTAVVKIPTELVGDCVERAGWRRGPRLAFFMWTWAIVSERRGHQVGIEEFGAAWGKTTRRAYHYLAEFRAAYPELGEGATPAALIRLERARTIMVLRAGELVVS